MRRLGSSVTLVVSALAIAACQMADPGQYRHISFLDQPPFFLNVARVEIDEHPFRNLNPPHVGHRFPVPPDRAARTWIRHRLRPDGAGGVAVATVYKADAVEIEPGLELGQRYEMTIHLAVEAEDARGHGRGRASVKMSLRATVPAGATEAERADIWHQLTQDTMAAFDAGMDRQIRANLAGFLGPP